MGPERHRRGRGRGSRGGGGEGAAGPESGSGARGLHVGRAAWRAGFERWCGGPARAAER